LVFWIRRSGWFFVFLVPPATVSQASLNSIFILYREYLVVLFFELQWPLVFASISSVFAFLPFQSISPPPSSEVVAPRVMFFFPEFPPIQIEVNHIERDSFRCFLCRSGVSFQGFSRALFLARLLCKLFEQFPGTPFFPSLYPLPFPRLGP